MKDLANREASKKNRSHLKPVIKDLISEAIAAGRMRNEHLSHRRFWIPPILSMTGLAYDAYLSTA